MLAKAEEILVLFGKHLRGELSADEQKALDELLQSSEDIQEMFNKINSEEEFINSLGKYYNKAGNVSDEKIRQVFNSTLESAIVITMTAPKRYFMKWVAAVAVVLLVGTGIYFWQTNKQPEIAITDKKQQPTPQEIMPANGFAILVLDDDRKVVLDSLGNGIVTASGGKEIVKQENYLSYQGISEAVVYNMLITSKGKIMNLKLADGTEVWLNAKSSIRFPTAFPGADRIVEVSGEAYFAVSRNAQKPFRVFVKKDGEKACEVQVTGTHFNVKAYSDEGTIQATLLEGAITVVKDNAKKQLTPGQQAAITNEGLSILNVNTDAVIAWKERNFFYFRNNDISTIMRQLERWYDITVKYDGNLPDRTFSGQVSRELSLSAVLNMLEQANVRFSMNGREVTVKE